MSHGELHSHDINFTTTEKEIVVLVFHSKVHLFTLTRAHYYNVQYCEGETHDSLAGDIKP